jgi:hypothetical protein
MTVTCTSNDDSLPHSRVVSFNNGRWGWWAKLAALLFHPPPTPRFCHRIHQKAPHDKLYIPYLDRTHRLYHSFNTFHWVVLFLVNTHPSYQPLYLHSIKGVKCKFYSNYTYSHLSYTLSLCRFNLTFSVSATRGEAFFPVLYTSTLLRLSNYRHPSHIACIPTLCKLTHPWGCVARFQYKVLSLEKAVSIRI